MFYYPAELQHNSRGGGGPHAAPVQHSGRHTQVPPLREVPFTTLYATRRALYTGSPYVQGCGSALI